MIILAIAAALSLGADTAADKAVFEKVCGSCHASAMVSEVKSRVEWIETVEQMVTLGAKGTPAEFAAVQRYLSAVWSRVNVNTADAAEIAAVLEQNDAAAAAIVAAREKQGMFKSFDDVAKLPGVDKEKLGAKKDRVTFQ